MLLDPREVGGMGVTRPARRGSSKQTAAAASGKAASDTGSTGIVTDSMPGRTAPAGAIPPRPRKKKRR
jgi:hypothetical protein